MFFTTESQNIGQICLTQQLFIFSQPGGTEFSRVPGCLAGAQAMSVFAEISGQLFPPKE